MSDAVKVVEGRPHGPGTHTGCRNPSGDGSIVSAVPENMGVDTEFVPIRPPGAEQEGAKNFVHSQDCPVDEKIFCSQHVLQAGGKRPRPEIAVFKTAVLKTARSMTPRLPGR